MIKKDYLIENLSADFKINRSQRYGVHWKVCIVYENKGNSGNEIFHGRTFEVSQTGASILADHNIFVKGPIKILLALPWHVGKLKERIIEINSRMVYTILSSDHQRFRVGINFMSFKDGEGQLLEAALKDQHKIKN